MTLSENGQTNTTTAALIDLRSYPVSRVLSELLKDKTTKKNIVWATDSYFENGKPIDAEKQITKGALLGLNAQEIQPRVLKTAEIQSNRTKSKAEVFTPSWICNRMNNDLDAEWFGRRDIFNFEGEKTWKINPEKVSFPKGKIWQDYVLSRRLEITCGEAPYLVSRYDTTSGKIIFPPECRIGILDRKLRVVKENTVDEETWLKWAYKAFQSVYGYEFQGDNLLIGRVNLLCTFTDYLEDRWGRMATLSELRKVANIIAWNLWQMDGLTGTVPFKAKQPEHEQMSIFDFNNSELDEQKENGCKIYDWVANKSQSYESLKGGK